MFISEEGGTQPRSNKTGVISCRLPFDLKLASERLAQEKGIVLSHILREFLEETVRRRDPHWWYEFVEDMESRDEEVRLE